MKPDKNKLQEWAREIHANATRHGWHEGKMPNGHWLAMIMTEVAEAIEADRVGRHADETTFKRLLYAGDEGKVADSWFLSLYGTTIKGTVEEELADITIRILDASYEIHGEKQAWVGYDSDMSPRPSVLFTEAAFGLVKDVLNSGTMNLAYSIDYMFDWAWQLGIDLSWHIEQKMKYNTFREYKHGGKKY